jgi:putative phage-type endonuclease
MIEQRSQEWFAQRKGRVTGSMVGAILGFNPYMTAADAMRRMVRDYHGAEPEFTGNQATEYGTFHEAGAIIDFEMQTGLRVEPAGFVDYEDWLGASPDGYVSDGGLIEVKCPYSQRDKQNPSFKKAFEQMHYYAQMQIQMFVAKKDFCWFWQWSPRGTLLERVEYDVFFIYKFLPVLHYFYHDYLIQIKNPDHLAPKLKEIYKPAVVKMAEEYSDIVESIDALTERKKELLEKIIEASGGENCIINGMRLTQVERPGSVSYAKAIKELAPDADLSKWTGQPTKYWRFA